MDLSAIEGAFGELQLGALEYATYDACVAADDASQLPPNEDDDEAFDDVGARADAACEQMEDWLSAYAELDEKASGAGAGASAGAGTDEDGAPVGSAARVKARADLISCIAGINDKWNKGIVMLVQRAVVTFLSAPLVSDSAHSAVCVRALAFTKLYFALLRVPGSSSFGLFEPNVLRRSLAVWKRFFEMASASTPAGGAVAAKRVKPAAAPLKAAAEGSRKNPKRGATAPKGEGEAEEQEVGEEEDAMEVEEEGEEEAEEGQPKRKAPAKKRAAPKRGAGTGDRDGRYIVFSPSDTRTVTDGLATLRSLIATFPLRAHQEFIPLAAQALAAALMLPAHVAPGAAPTPADVTATIAGLLGVGSHSKFHPLVLTAATMLALLDPIHASPLLTARYILKRLKPYLLHGHAGGSAAAGQAAAGADVPVGIDEESTAARAALGIDTSKPAHAPDARAVRARALYLTRVLVSDDLGGAVTLHSSDADSSGVTPIRAEVLARLPAVTALLQHLANSAVTLRADVRSVAAEIIAHLRACLPHSLRRAFLRFILKFGRASKQGQRMLAVEVVGRLLGVGQAKSAGAGEAGAIVVEGGEAGEGGAVLGVAMAELPVPSDADCALESEGYGEEGLSYAEMRAGDEGGGEEGLADPATPGGASRRSTGSINLMGSDNASGAGTPTSSWRSKGAPASGARSVGSRGAGSPFYGRRKSGVMAGAGGASYVVDATETEGGCANPRPTVTALLDALLRRASDKSPGVRARALAILGEVVDPTASPHARTMATLLTHLGYTAVRLAAVSGSEGGEEDVSLSESGFGTALASGNAFEDALEDAASSAIGGSRSRPRPILPAGIQVLTAAGPSPLVPLLVRRMGDDKPAVRRAALIAGVALGSAGGSDIVYASELVQEDAEAMGWQTAARLHLAVFRAAQTIAARALTASSTTNAGGFEDGPGTPLRTLGLFALQSMAARATDGSVIVRKTALLSLHSLVRAQPTSGTLQQLWLATVVPMVTDAEGSVSATAVEAIREAMVDPLLAWHVAALKREKAGAAGTALLAVDASLILPWHLLALSATHDELCGCLGRALGVLAKPSGGAGGRGAGAPLPTSKLIASLTYAASAVDKEEAPGAGAGAGGLDTSFNLSALASSAVRGGAPTAATYRRAAWLMLELLAGQVAAVMTGTGRLNVPEAGSGGPATAFAGIMPFLVRAWGTMAASLSVAREAGGVLDLSLAVDSARVLRILSLVPSAVEPGIVKALVGAIGTGLSRFTWEPSIISAAVQAIAAMSASHAGAQGKVTAASIAWWGPVQAKAEDLLRVAASGGGLTRAAGKSGAGAGLASVAEAETADAVCMALFTVGEAALVAMDADAGNGLTERGEGKEAPPGALRLQPTAIAMKLQTLVQALMSDAAGLNEAVRAHAVLALGKLCLREPSLAKACLPVFIRDLHPSAGAPMAVRNNALFVLGDLCVRYTSLVDRHAIAVAGAIRDPSPTVRRHALVLLAQLVGSDYLKWRAPIFYRFAAAIADVDADVRDAAHAALMGPLLSKDRLLLQSHFMDLLFVLTGCVAHPAYARLAAAATGAGRRGGSGVGAGAGRATGTFHVSDEGEEEEAAEGDEGEVVPGLGMGDAPSLVMPDPLRRLHVYRVLLEHMAEDQRLTVHFKLVQSVLGGVLDGTLRLTDPRLLAATMAARPSTGGRVGAGSILALTPAAAAKAAVGEGVDPDVPASAGSGPAASLLFPLGTTEALVSEVLAVLSSPDMRTQSRGGGGGGEDGAEGAVLEEGGEGGAAEVMAVGQAAAKSRLLGKIQRKAVGDNVMPVVMALKARITTARSPLLGPLMAYIAGLVADYGSEVKGESRPPAACEFVLTPSPDSRRGLVCGPHHLCGAGVGPALVQGGQHGHVLGGTHPAACGTRCFGRDARPCTLGQHS
jgi:hypothetical protein